MHRRSSASELDFRARSTFDGGMETQRQQSRRERRKQQKPSRLMLGLLAANVVLLAGAGFLGVKLIAHAADGSSAIAASAPQQSPSTSVEPDISDPVVTMEDDPSATAPADATAPVEQAPAPEAAGSGTSVCDTPEAVDAVASGDVATLSLIAGGPEALRAQIAVGAASCVNTSDPSALWFVVNKQRPFDPIGFEPANLVEPEGIESTYAGARLDSRAALALTQLAQAVSDSDVGTLRLASAHRSYSFQEGLYGGYVQSDGQGKADAESARPGYSEHQTGLTADLSACDDNGCSDMGAFGNSAVGVWVAENAWQYGWIVRYAEGRQDVTGYEAEPWHIRYIGPELATAYHDGGFTTLEEFFGLPAAPEYAAG